MFDDSIQKDIIASQKQIITEANSKIDTANEKIEINNRLKSILYSSGDELVDVVFEMLQDMIGCDLSTFVDMKREDFLFELEDKVYIGEIKGINSNVRRENISQLDLYVNGYIDEHPDKKNNIVALLIINHQRKTRPDERVPVHEDQIRLAKRNNSLIIETSEWLKLYSDYKSGAVSQGEILQILGNTGIMKRG